MENKALFDAVTASLKREWEEIASRIVHEPSRKKYLQAFEGSDLNAVFEKVLENLRSKDFPASDTELYLMALGSFINQMQTEIPMSALGLIPTDRVITVG